MTDFSSAAAQNGFFSTLFPGAFSKTPGAEIFREQRRLTVSGLPNISAKLFFLQKILEAEPGICNILLVLPEKNELHETMALAPYFLSHLPPESLHVLSFSEGRGREKVEWILSLQDMSPQNTRNIFFCTEADAAEYFPDPEFLKNESLLLECGQKISALQLFHKLVELGYSLTSDLFLQKGEYRRSGNVVDLFPLGATRPVKIEISYDEVESIFEFFPETKKVGNSLERIQVSPLAAPEKTLLSSVLTENDL